MHFRFINTGYSNAAMNMAIDEALLESKFPVLRVYGWKPAAISIGYNQDLKKHINLDACKKLGIEIARRPTGGKAVLHDKELTYSVIIDLNDKNYDSDKIIPKNHKESILESYKMISKGILNALQSLGISAVMKDCKPEKTDTAICFNEPSWYEILADGKKLVGSAQRRINGKILQHGAILIGCDIEKMCKLFNTDFENAVKATKERVTSINELKSINQLRNINKSTNRLTDKTITFQNIANALKLGFEKNFNIEFADDNLTQEELAAADRLYQEKYNTDGWNLGE